MLTKGQIIPNKCRQKRELPYRTKKQNNICHSYVTYKDQVPCTKVVHAKYLLFINVGKGSSSESQSLSALSVASQIPASTNPLCTIPASALIGNILQDPGENLVKNLLRILHDLTFLT